MSTLRSALTDLAETFASSVLNAIRTASLEDLLVADRLDAAPARRGPGHPRGAAKPRATKAIWNPKTNAARAPRRSPEEIQKALGLVLLLLKQGPLSGKEIRAKLGIDKGDLPRVLEQARDAGKIKTTGERRAMVYRLA